VPTARRRHAITETPPVQAALDELIVLGAREKVAQLRERQQTLRQRLAQRMRDRRVPVDPDAAEHVRRTGWARG
jgi:hypothetical protein